jgi:nitrite reductase/ring-hydroxylating ferredoxin subunit
VSFVRIASVDDIKVGKMMGSEVSGKAIFLANLSGNYYAFENCCSHRGCKLSNGTLIDGQVQCPCHGSVFDVKTGILVKGPAKEPKTSIKLKVENGEIFADIG